MGVVSISKLSDHAAVLCRERNAKAVFILVAESDDTFSQGMISLGATPSDVQDMLCAAICENRKAGWEDE